MSKRRLLYLLALLYVVLLSALPIVNDLETVNSWVGYGWGYYRYTTERLNIVYEGVSVDGDRLKLDVRPPHSFSKYVTALILNELEIQNHNLSQVTSLKVKSISPLSKGALLAVYEGTNGEVSELIKASSKEGIHIEILCNEACSIALILKHYYLTYVKSINTSSEGSVQEFNINYGFGISDKLFTHASGNISISPLPTSISILHDSEGIYGVKISLINVSKVNITIHKILWGKKEEVDPPSMLEWILTTRTVHASYIIIALLISALWWKKWVRERS